MNSYTITIAPNDDSGNSTTLIVDTSGDQVRITDVHLHATDGLTGGQMPTVDFGLLLRAVATSADTPTPIEATPAAAPVAAPPTPADAAEPTAELVDEVAAARPARPAKAVAPTRRRAKRPTAPATTAEPAAQPDDHRAPAATTAGGKAAKATAKRAGVATGTARKKATKKATKKAAAKPAATGGRVYRRMPDDFTAVYQQTGNAAAIADHYGVPRHTAQGWIRRVKASNTAATGS